MAVPDSFSRFAEEDAEVTILDLKQPGWRKAIYDAIDPPFTETAPLNRGEKAFLRILDIAEELDACAAVVEPYVSTDWSEEFGAIYSRVFDPPAQRATRIHFFARHKSDGCLTAEELFLIDEPLQRAYLGYTVLRPLPAYRVGDTVLKTPCFVRLENGAGVEEKMYLSHCAAKHRTSLLGNTLWVKGMPFLQQETTVVVCAEADLWMLARYLNRLGETARYRPAQITEIATRIVTVGPPREGLDDGQIAGALRDMGLHSRPFWPKDHDEARAFLYSCVESSLPVIAACGKEEGPGHVLLVIGHDYKAPMHFDAADKSMSDIVAHFHVHDDAEGPYLTVPIGHRKTEDVDILMLGDWDLDVCFVPLPARVHMSWEDVVTRMIPGWLANIREFAFAELQNAGVREDQLWPSLSPDDLVQRVYLRRSKDFKKDLLRSEQMPRDPEVVAQYRCMPMPRYVWVVEFARRADLEGVSPYARTICGEMVLDSTANRHAIESTLLAFHLDGLMFVPAKKGKSPAFIEAENKGSYRPLLRVDGGPERTRE